MLHLQLRTDANNAMSSPSAFKIMQTSSFDQVLIQKDPQSAGSCISIFLPRILQGFELSIRQDHVD